MVRLTLSRNSAAISATLGKEADGSQLRLSESSIASRFKVSPKMQTDAIFDFCNKICTFRTSRDVRLASVVRMILLQKSFWRRCLKFSGPQARFSCRDLRRLTLNS